MSATPPAPVIVACGHGGDYRLRSLYNVPVLHAIFVLIETGPDERATQWGHQLEEQLTAVLSESSPGVIVPENSRIVDPVSIEAFQEPDRRKLLVVVAGEQPVEDRDWFSSWPAVLPILRRGDNLTSLLPQRLFNINAKFWHDSIGESVPAILELADVTPRNPGLFISYRRTETQALFQQLTKALDQEGFRIFPSNRATRPGADYQEQLNKELLDTSVLLVLESRSVDESQWIIHEMDLAKRLRVGILALEMPDRKRGFFNVAPDDRMMLSAGDFETPASEQWGSLTQPALQRVVSAVHRANVMVAFRRSREILEPADAALESPAVAEVAQTAPLRAVQMEPASFGKRTCIGPLYVNSKPETDVQLWIAEHRKGAARLACTVSLATIVEPELLRAARLEFCPELDAENESLVWFSPLVASRSALGLIFSPEAIQELRSHAQGQADLLKAMRDLTSRYHRGIAPALEWEEEIAYQALTGSPLAPGKIGEMLRQALKTMLASDRGMAIWAERALPRMPEAVRANETYTLLAQAAFERGGRMARISGAAAGPAWLKPRLEDTTIGVKLTGRAVEFSRPPASGAISAMVPAANPIKLMLSDNPEFAASPGFPRIVTLYENNKVSEHVHLIPELYVRPAGGRTFVVQPVSDQGIKPRIYLAYFSGLEEAGLAKFVEDNLHADFDIRSGRDQFESLEIAGRDVLLLVVSSYPKGPVTTTAFLAISECRRVIYLLAPRSEGEPEAADTEVLDFRQTEEWNAALNELKALLRVPSRRPGELFGLPRAVVKGVDTPEPTKRLLELLLDGTSHWLVLSGDDGSGRSTIARVLIGRCDVRRRFPNGIFWICAGTPVETSGPGKLFVVDYSVPNWGRADDLSDSVVLFTKSPPKIPVDSITIPVPRWSEDQIIARYTEIGTDVWGSVNPLVCDALQSIGDDPPPPFKGPPFVRAADALNFRFEHMPEEHRELIRQFRAFVPDAVLSLSVRERVIGKGVAGETMYMVEQWGFLRGFSGDTIAVREIAPPLPQASSETHQKLVASYEADCDADWALGPDDGYFFQFLIHHILLAGKTEEAKALIYDLDWLLSKWTHAGDRSMLSDLERFRNDAVLSALAGVVLQLGNDVQKVELARALATPRANARMKFWESGPTVWILVVGSGGMHITDSVVFASETLGRELARAGYGLISGGWPGVDHMVCREYVKQLRRDEVPAQGRLRHVVPADSTPDFWAVQEFYQQGDLDAAGSPEESIARSIDRSAAVVTIGGSGATYGMIQIARRRQKFVLPLASTGGDSERAFKEMTNAPRALAAPIGSRREARTVVQALMQLLSGPQAAQTGA
jgi:hypothetical protein